MSETHDDVLQQHGHKVVRDKTVITIIKGEVMLQRRYKTEHAALCAMGRCRSDHAFTKTLMDSIMVEQLKGSKRNEQNPATGLQMEHLLMTVLRQRAEETERTHAQIIDTGLQMEHLLMTALRQRAEEKGQTHRQIIATWIQKAAAARRKNLESEGLNEVRDALHRHNQAQSQKEGEA
jgi:hypothetical protein